jgi:TetR/AcrR family transcriptional repressor of nem operon
MRRSRSETVETKKRIVAAASGLFLDRGLDSVGMRDVMEAAELTAGGFYRHFSSKNQLIAEAMLFAFDRLFAMFDKEIRGKEPVKALERIVSLYLQQTLSGRDGQAPYLCPLAQLGSQLSRCAPVVRAVAIEGHKRLAALIAGCLGHRPHEKADAKTIVSVLVGAETLASLATDARSASRTRFLAKVAILQQFSNAYG